ncbi:MAG: hypothetical protein ACLTZT_02835 [Butyricimonas faecalis]
MEPGIEDEKLKEALDLLEEIERVDEKKGYDRLVKLSVKRRDVCWRGGEWCFLPRRLYCHCLSRGYGGVCGKRRRCRRWHGWMLSYPG